jgi:N-acetylglutamate synthase-like GNAT family acetyltransferase
VRVPRETSRRLLIRDATDDDLRAIESMVADFVKGHPAENHPRSLQALRAAYFGERPVAHMLIAERNGQIVGMAQWTLLYDMFWGMFGAEAAWLYVRPECRGSGIVAALVARLCAQAAAAGAQFVHGGGGEGPARLYERVAIGQVSRDCHLSGKAFQVFAALDGLLPREIVRRLPARALGLQPAEP